MQREKKETQIAHGRMRFGIVPKLLLGILSPLVIVLVVITIFLGLRGSETINGVMGAELDAEAKVASNEVNAFFERYFGISECLAATQIIRDTTTQEV